MSKELKISVTVALSDDPFVSAVELNEAKPIVDELRAHFGDAVTCEIVEKRKRTASSKPRAPRKPRTVSAEAA